MDIPIIDLPQALGDEDTRTLAQNMTDEELRALVVIMFQWQREILAFTRAMSQMIEAVSANPMFGAMMPAMPNAQGSQMDRLRAAGLVAP
jgi:hypothetical protein